MERAGKIHKPKAASEHPKDAGSKHAPVASPLMTQAPSSPRWDVSRIPIFPPEPPTLPVGPVDDPLEHEADLAARIVEDTGGRMPPLKPAAAPEADIAPAPQIVHLALHTPGQPLDPSTRARMDRSFDYNFGAVRLHSDSLAARAAQSLNSAAFTVGEDIIFAPGRLAPSTTAGIRLLAHELAHVVQQDRGNLRTVQRSHEDGEDLVSETKKERRPLTNAEKIANAETALENLQGVKQTKETKGDKLEVDDAVLAYDGVHSVVLAASSSSDPALLEKARQLKSRLDSIVLGTPAAKPPSFTLNGFIAKFRIRTDRVKSPCRSQ
jgi:hypothetical protein